MYYKKLCFAIIALVVICTNVNGKKVRKNKRPKDQEEPTTIQPNVVAYSTFGFNDVGSYDGFVPTSPEYSSFLSGVNQESSTRLYAPAFPSAADSTGFGGNYGSQSYDGQAFGATADGASQPGMSQYTSNSMNFMSTPNFMTTGEQSKNTDSEDTNNNQNREESDSPVYGTKIGARLKNRPNYPISNSEFGANNNGFQNPSDEKYFNYHESEQTQEKPAFSEPNLNYQNTPNSYTPSYGPQENDDFTKQEPSNVHGVLNFPRVVDFTKLSNKYYPTELDTSKLTSESIKHSNQQMSMANAQIDNSFANQFNNNRFVDNAPAAFAEQFNIKNNEETNDKNVYKSNTYFEPDFTNKHVASHYKHNEPNLKKPDPKKKIKHKPWNSGNYSNAFKDWKDSSASASSSVKGYGYSTNYSNMNFKYDVSEPKKPFNHDEIVPASSNVVDLTSYQFPERDYSNFKKMPEFNTEDEFPSASFYREKYKSNDFLNQFKNSFSTVPTTTSSYWGNVFKSTDYSSYGDHPKKPHYSVTENNHEDVVSIPKRPHKLGYTKGSQNKQHEWPSAHYRPQKLNKPDWTKDFLDTRYKSEEDLLGLRTHDTSHPSYLPTYKPNVVDNDNDFKQLIEKWRQSYIKTKYRDVPSRDYEGYGSEVKPYHVAVPKPYPIEVPHPVIVPVPRPFPVRVPISRPVAVPVLRELTVPIEKPVPYPVYKNVPYPVEKPVPVPVEKEVAVPVEKPYPVHIPYVRPVFHHTKPVHEDPDHIDEEDYPRRPEYKKPSQYKKRPVYGSRNKTRRPSRASYQDRNRRRWPDRRRPSGYPEYRQSSRPNGFQHSSPYRHHDFEREVDEDERSDYALYCKKTGNC